LWSGNPKGRDHLEDLGVDERIVERMYLEASKVGCVNWNPYAFMTILTFLPSSNFGRQSKAKTFAMEKT
jgi:hypothetical protein